MPKTSTSYALLEADEPRFYPSDLTPALQQALAILADLDLSYDEAREKLALCRGPDALKQRLSEQLEARRKREREPILCRLAELQKHIRRAVGAQARPLR